MAGSPYIIIDRAHIVADPETRTTQLGQQVMSFRIAVNPSTYNKQTKQWDDGKPQFYKITEWDAKRQEQYAANLSKGTAVSVTGYLDIDTYQIQSGEQRTENIIMRARVSLLMTTPQQAPQPASDPYAQPGGYAYDSAAYNEPPF